MCRCSFLIAPASRHPSGQVSYAQCLPSTHLFIRQFFFRTPSDDQIPCDCTLRRGNFYELPTDSQEDPKFEKYLRNWILVPNELHVQQHIVQALFKDKRRLRNVWCKVFLNLLIYAKERWLKIQKELSKEIADAEAAVAAANAACAEDDDGIGESEMQEARERLEQAQAAHAEAQTDLSNLSPLDLAAPTTEETDDAAGLPPGLDLPSSLVTPETLLVGDEA